jgi:hypothetical protein
MVLGQRSIGMRIESDFKISHGRPVVTNCTFRPRIRERVELFHLRLIVTRLWQDFFLAPLSFHVFVRIVRILVKFFSNATILFHAGRLGALHGMTALDR